MRVEILEGSPGFDREMVTRLLSRYGPVVVLDPEPPGPERVLELWLASFPLDASTGHGPEGATEAYAGYELPPYAAGPGATLPAAIALWDRVCLVAHQGGPPREVRPAVFAVPTCNPAAIAGCLHRALEATLAEVASAYQRLPPGLSPCEAARLLEVSPEALARALGRSEEL